MKSGDGIGYRHRIYWVQIRTKNGKISRSSEDTFHLCMSVFVVFLVLVSLPVEIHRSLQRQEIAKEKLILDWKQIKRRK